MGCPGPTYGCPSIPPLVAITHSLYISSLWALLFLKKSSPWAGNSGNHDDVVMLLDATTRRMWTTNGPPHHKEGHSFHSTAATACRFVSRIAIASGDVRLRHRQSRRIRTTGGRTLRRALHFDLPPRLPRRFAVSRTDAKQIDGL